MKKIAAFSCLFLSFYTLCFSQTKVLQFRAVLTEQESQSTPFDKYIDNFGKEILVDKEVLLSNKDIDKIGIVKASREFPNESLLVVAFTNSGKGRFFEVTKESLNKRLAIIVDDNVLTAPYIIEAIDTGQTMIPVSSFNAAEELIKHLGFAPYLHGNLYDSSDEDDSYRFGKYAMEIGRQEIAEEIVLQIYKYNPKSEFSQKLIKEYPSLGRIVPKE